MGLDNGIIIKDITRDKLPKFLHYPFNKDYGNGVEICYWRKWWPFRNAIMQYLLGKYKDKEWEIQIDIEDIDIIVSELKYYIHNPEEATSGYWENDTVKKVIRENLWNLFWIKGWMHTHPEAEVVFYDSY